MADGDVPNPDNVTPDVTAGLQAAQTAGPNIAPPVAANVMGGPVPTLPNAGEVAVHEHVGFMRNILDHVANIMGGGETYHVTKDPDGNVSIDKGPATTGEKWGRIAAAALGGAATGLAQQGVNAPARSVAAGFQVGQQVAQAPRQRAEEEAQLQQQLQMRNAQNALVHQQLLASQFNNQIAPRKWAHEEASNRLELASKLDDLGATDEGAIGDEADMFNLHDGHPHVMQYHMGQGGMVLPLPMPDGKTHMFTIPHNAANERITEPIQAPKQLHLTGDGTTFEELPETNTFPAGTKKSEVIEKTAAREAANDKVRTAAMQNKTRLETAQQPRLIPGAFTTGQGGIVTYTVPRAGGAATPVPLTGATGRVGGGGGEGAAALSPQDLDSAVKALADISSGARLETFPIKQRAAILTEMGRRGLNLAHPLTPREIDRADLANNAVNNIDEAVRILDAHPELFGPLGKGRVTFQQLLEGGNPNATAFKAAVDAANFPVLGIHGFRSRYGLAKLDQLDSDFYTNAEATRAALMELRRSSNEFGRMGGRVPAVGQTGSVSPPTMGGNPAPATESAAPAGATMEYRDASGALKGWAVGGKFVPVPSR